MGLGKGTASTGALTLLPNIILPKIFPPEAADIPTRHPAGIPRRHLPSDKSGRASRTRTCDLPSPRRTRYQAAL